MPPLNGVKIELGGKQRRLRYTTLTMMRLEELTGDDLLVVLSRAETNLTATVQMVWAGLLHEVPEITLDQVAELVPLPRIKDARESIGKAVTLAFGKLVEEGKDEGNALAAG